MSVTTIGPDAVTLAGAGHRGRAYHPTRYNCSIFLADVTGAAFDLAEVYPGSEAWGDLVLADHARLWSSVEYAAGLTGSMEVDTPTPGRWHVVQGWRNLGTSGHAFLWYAIDDTHGVALESQVGLGASANGVPLSECLDDGGRLTVEPRRWDVRVREYVVGDGVRLAALRSLASASTLQDLVGFEEDSDDGAVVLLDVEEEGDPEMEELRKERASLAAELQEAHLLLGRIGEAGWHDAAELVRKHREQGDERNRRRSRRRKGKRTERRSWRRNGQPRREVVKDTRSDSWVDALDLGSVSSLADLGGLADRLAPVLRGMAALLDDDTIVARVVPVLDERLRWERAPWGLDEVLEEQDGPALELLVRQGLRAVRAAL